MTKQQSIKGQKGFQSIPLEELKTKRVIFRLSPIEQTKLLDYCNKNNTTIADLLRSRIKDIVE